MQAEVKRRTESDRQLQTHFETEVKALQVSCVSVLILTDCCSCCKASAAAQCCVEEQRAAVTWHSLVLTWQLHIALLPIFLMDSGLYPHLELYMSAGQDEQQLCRAVGCLQDQLRRLSTHCAGLARYHQVGILTSDWLCNGELGSVQCPPLLTNLHCHSS